MATNGKKPKVVLFHPHYFNGDYFTCQLEPLNMMAISAIPDQRGYEMVIVDASVHSDYRQRVLEACDGALCFATTSIAGYQVYHAYEMTKAVKEKYPDLPIISGGWFPSVDPRMVLEQGLTDAVVMRQGEYAFMDYLEALQSGSSLKGIEGIIYKDGDEIVQNPPRKIADLNEMPPMPYHLIDFEDYFRSDPYYRFQRIIHNARGVDFWSTKVRALDYFSSYGCPDGCNFCSSPTVLDRKWTALDGERVVDEIDHLVKKHHFNVLTFHEANWGVSEKRVFDICDGFLKKGIKLYWIAAIEARVMNGFDKKVVEAMSDSGCVGLCIGGETSHPTTMASLGKNIKPGDIKKVTDTATRYGMMAEVSYIVGFPDETTESVDQTLLEACEMVYRWPMAEINPRLYLPIPGTPFHDRTVEKGYKPVTNIHDWKDFRNFQSEFHLNIPESRLKLIRRLQRHYFWFASERFKEREKPTIFERLLRVISRFRLKHRLLKFPIEYKVYHVMRNFFSPSRSC